MMSDVGKHTRYKPRETQRIKEVPDVRAIDRQNKQTINF